MKIITFDEIDSTNIYLEKHISELPSPTIVRARFQTNGHGRRDHHWDSRKDDDLLFSILIKDERPPFAYAMIAAYSIIELLADFHIDATIKFPNDIYVGDQKIAGILTTAIYQQGYQGTIIGMGINVFNPHYLSLYQLTNRSLQIESLMMKLIRLFFHNVRGDFVKIIDEINQRSFLQGKRINYGQYGEVLFDSIDVNGNVKVVTEKGKVFLPLNEINLG